MINPRGAPLSSTPMSELPLQTTLEGHTTAITVLEFSADGRFLASAADNGVVLIFSTSSWAPVCRFLDVSPVSALAWHPRKRYLLFCGHQSGDLHVLTMSKSMVRSRHFASSRTHSQWENSNVLSSRLQRSRGVFIPSPSRQPRLA